ncbi:S-adenosyl-L-methionine-dependent methyltransferase [Suillus hirtellus]|nr:S-adenosyl-L-methionine-dependent methyltransferase [Suillus hirtellus]
MWTLVNSAMATFTKSSFDSAIYATFRLTYPRLLFDFIFQYHKCNNSARWNRAVDLGCGMGQATIELTPFKRITGVNPSSKMIQVAQGTIKNTPTSTGQYKYIQVSAENLAFSEDSSMDLVISAQACHWFDWNKIWPELARRMEGYSQLRLTRYLSLTQRINTYVEGTDPLNSIGSYWEQPGHLIFR